MRMGVRSTGISTDRKVSTVGLGVCRNLRDAVVAVLVTAGLFSLQAGAVDLVSVATNGKAANGASGGPASSEDGNFVAFFSDATNLVANDSNSARDVFWRDIGGNVTQRISVSSSGAQANGPSQAAGGSPSISGDGQIIAFYSDATNLVAGDTNGRTDVFVRVLGSNTTEIVSVATDGTPGNGASLNPSISRDGRFVAFQSLASNLVANDTNNVSDIFVRDRVNHTTERACGGTQGNRFSYTPAISANGNFVAFASAATNLATGDTNNKLDIFVCDRTTGKIELVSVGLGGLPGDGDSILPAISEDGHVVGFKSLATNLVPNDTDDLVDVFVRDRAAATTTRVSVNVAGGNPNDFSFPPSLDFDGRFVGFGSFATNLVPTDSNNSSNVFVRDLKIDLTKLADVNSAGDQANNGTPDAPPAMSGDGMKIAFTSFASNLVANDTNSFPDVFSAPNPFFCPTCCPNDVCPAGQVCIQGMCVVPTPSPTATKTATSTVTPTRTPSPTPTATFKPCESDMDCPPGKHCRGGFCKIERPCEDNTTCFPREACVFEGTEMCGTDICPINLCECGGDCNLDGFVLGNEITKAILILGGVVPLSQCQAADINGDGQVMGNEITQGVLNLGEGCRQESQPLVFAHDRTEVVTLTVGSAAVAGGGAVTISIDLSGGIGQVASAQMDLLFDPNVLDIGTPATSCVLDPRLTDEVLAATLPSSLPAPAGLQRLRLFVGDITAPIAVFGDGPIVSCTFQVKDGAQGGSTVLGADRLNVGDAFGNTFGTQAVQGGVSIVVPTSTPVPVPTAAPVCPGDCDGDGEVLGNEITVAVRIMAGTLPLTECPAADADGDGEVFVTDITRAVLSLGRGCPR